MLSSRAIALQGIGFAAALIAVQGLASVTDVPQVQPTGERIIWENLKRIPVQVVTARGEAAEKELAKASAVLISAGLASAREMTADRAAGVLIETSAGRMREGGSAGAHGIVTVDRARLARLDDDLMWL